MVAIASTPGLIATMIPATRCAIIRV
jgi:hypothetical protein